MDSNYIYIQPENTGHQNGIEKAYSLNFSRYPQPFILMQLMNEHND